jgi:hypothetical protein
MFLLFGSKLNSIINSIVSIHVLIYGENVNFLKFPHYIIYILHVFKKKVVFLLIKS